MRCAATLTIDCGVHMSTLGCGDREPRRRVDAECAETREALARHLARGTRGDGRQEQKHRATGGSHGPKTVPGSCSRITVHRIDGGHDGLFLITHLVLYNHATHTPTMVHVPVTTLTHRKTGSTIHVFHFGVAADFEPSLPAQLLTHPHQPSRTGTCRPTEGSGQ